MLKALFGRKPERDRIESSPVSEHLDPFAVALASQKATTVSVTASSSPSAQARSVLA